MPSKGPKELVYDAENLGNCEWHRISLAQEQSGLDLADGSRFVVLTLCIVSDYMCTHAHAPARPDASQKDCHACFLKCIFFT